MKVAYFGFDLFYDCLEYVCSKHQLIKIFTCEVDGDYETNGKTYSLAQKYSIPITTEKPNLSDIEQLEKDGCELIISAGYYFKIPISHKIKSINIHPSLLPEGRGPWPLPVVILRNLPQTGISVHQLTQQLDEGDILAQLTIDVADDENLDTLTSKSQNNALLLLKNVLCDFDAFWNNKSPQKKGSYWCEPSVNDMTFTLENSYEDIDKIVRAFYGYKCYLKLSDRTLCIKQAVCISDEEFYAEKYILTFKINGGYLCILKLT